MRELILQYNFARASYDLFEYTEDREVVDLLRDVDCNIIATEVSKYEDVCIWIEQTPQTRHILSPVWNGVTNMGINERAEEFMRESFKKVPLQYIAYWTMTYPEPVKRPERNTKHMTDVIIIEGLDGCGKKTISSKLVDIIPPGKKVLHLEAPNYDLASGKIIDNMLHDKIQLGCNPYVISTTYIMNRLENYMIYEKEMENADVIIIDRSWMSNVMYQIPSLQGFPEHVSYLFWEYHAEIENTFFAREDVNIHLFHLRHEDFDFGRSLLLHREEISGNKLDKFEINTDYQQNVLAVSDKLCEDIRTTSSSILKKYFLLENVYASTRLNKLRTPEDIAEEIFQRSFITCK